MWVGGKGKMVKQEGKGKKNKKQPAKSQEEIFIYPSKTKKNQISKVEACHKL